MHQIKINTTVDIYPDKSVLPAADLQLLEQAIEASQKAYAPYSEFYVGAALLLSNGTIILGSNQENASYPLCLCAERVAIAAASNYQLPVQAIAVMARNPRSPLTQPISPCGACRQVILETELRFQHCIRIILYGEMGEVFVVESAKDLLPLGFDAHFL